MKKNKIVLGGKQWVIAEPVFKDLKIILACLNRLNNTDTNDAQLVDDVQLIINCLITERHVKKFRHFRWEVWKLPAPTHDEITALLTAIPAICVLEAATKSTTSTAANDDWDALYWHIVRITGWDFETIDTTMTLSKLTALSEHLAKNPLVDELVAAYVGYEYTKPYQLEDEVKRWLASQGLSHG
jgi:hypothetical protein